MIRAFTKSFGKFFDVTNLLNLHWKMAAISKPKRMVFQIEANNDFLPALR
jgi:hypothetical protein